MGGKVILTSESDGDVADTVCRNLQWAQYVQTSFAPRIPGVNEGSSFVDCAVPTATPTTTPTATSTPTCDAYAYSDIYADSYSYIYAYSYSYIYATATATFTPTATATFTPTATRQRRQLQLQLRLRRLRHRLRPGHVSQITPTGTTCSQFANGTAETLLNLNYSVSSGKIKNNVTPGVFFYWVSVTAPAGNNSFTITQTITTGNFTG